MVDVVVSLGRLLVALLLVVLNGFFVAAEFALVKTRSTTVDALVEEGRPGAKTAREAIENLDDYLAVSQLGITISSLGLGWIGEPAVAALIDPVLEPLLPASTIHLVAFALGFGVITFLHVVFGELAPKTIAIQRAERIALLVAAPMKFFYYLFVPGIVVFNGTANFFTRLIGISPASEADDVHSEEEILMIVGRSGEKGDVEMDEVEMIEAVFDLSDMVARQIMVPRVDVVTVPADAPLDEIRDVAARGSYTRYPVVEEGDGDRVVGFVHVKDLFRLDDDERLATATARDIARDVIIVPEDRRIDDVLSAFQKRNVHMAVVIDEWGVFEGIVTIEDVLEEIVGDIRDEFDVAAREPSIEEVGDGVYESDGSVPLEAVNDALGAEFESEDFETIGGVVLSEIGRAPSVGDRATLDGYRVTVDEVEENRITRVTIEAVDRAGRTDAREAERSERNERSKRRKRSEHAENAGSTERSEQPDRSAERESGDAPGDATE